MAFTTKNLAQSQLGTGASTLYTAPGSTTTIIKHIAACNTSTSDATFSMSIVPSAGSAQDSNRILKDYVIDAKQTVLIDCAIVLETGDFISAAASAATTVTVTISGLEET